GELNKATGGQGGAILAGLAGVLGSTNLIPRDNEGRVNLKIGLGGLVSNPKIASLAFGPGTTGTAAQQPATPKQQVQQQIEKQVEKKIEQKKQDIQQELQKEAAKKLKGLFGK
ncbi:MAG: hypothetical protein JW699_07785, partial [Chitinispirillaceae bacterium]|nr:hypothetical protein [Chitinispirillaceae bacterium]